MAPPLPFPPPSSDDVEVGPEDLGISRLYDGWAGDGDITFRVTDADSEPPTAILLTFDPS